MLRTRFEWHSGFTPTISEPLGPSSVCHLASASLSAAERWCVMLTTVVPRQTTLATQALTFTLTLYLTSAHMFSAAPGCGGHVAGSSARPHGGGAQRPHGRDAAGGARELYPHDRRFTSSAQLPSHRLQSNASYSSCYGRCAGANAMAMLCTSQSRISIESIRRNQYA